MKKSMRQITIDRLKKDALGGPLFQESADYLNKISNEEYEVLSAVTCSLQWLSILRRNGGADGVDFPALEKQLGIGAFPNIHAKTKEQAALDKRLDKVVPG
jgi:hypothetical protein